MGSGSLNDDSPWLRLSFGVERCTTFTRVQMTLASWSSKGILKLWAAGLLLQALLILAPVLLARHLVADRGEVLRVAAEQDTRWRSGELADSLSLATQRAEARAARTYSVTASGDTLFPLVHVRSGRPDPVVVAALGERTRQTARYVTIAILGLIPSLLILVTVSWMILRRRDTGPPPALGTS